MELYVFVQVIVVISALGMSDIICYLITVMQKYKCRKIIFSGMRYDGCQEYSLGIYL
jgi:purine-nucleoside phosphorylase